MTNKYGILILLSLSCFVPLRLRAFAFDGSRYFFSSFSFFSPASFTSFASGIEW